MDSVTKTSKKIVRGKYIAIVNIKKSRRKTIIRAQKYLYTSLNRLARDSWMSQSKFCVGRSMILKVMLNVPNQCLRFYCCSKVRYGSLIHFGYMGKKIFLSIQRPWIFDSTQGLFPLGSYATVITWQPLYNVFFTFTFILRKEKPVLLHFAWE